jgi:hypothetical protein
VEDLIMHVLVLSEEKKEMIEKYLVEVGEEALTVLPIVLNTSPMSGKEAEYSSEEIL